MPLKNIETEQRDIRLTLTMPSRGRVIIEGDQKTVKQFWNNVKVDFIGRITDALDQIGPIKGEFEPVVIETKAE
jgi:hypothetical protein